MIRVNLLPGGKKGPSRGGGLPISLPQFKGLPTDKWVLGSAVVGVLVFLIVGWLVFSVGNRRGALEEELEEARQDSVRYADLIQRTEQLTARRDSIAEKVDIIQEIDQGRYVWPHIMDEIARALPDYTWLNSLEQVSAAPNLTFRLDGMAGNNFALTRFMNNLQSSPFFGTVDFVSSEQEVVGEGANQQVAYRFVLETSYQQPPTEYLETVPLFDGGDMAALSPDTLSP